MPEELGETTARQAVEVARDLWGGRLIAAYALGSLAHGGFSPLVSDVDLGLILADPVNTGDAQRADDLTRRTAASGHPLAKRLSVFWGTAATLRVEQVGGRFPALDRCDLLDYGRLLFGSDARRGLPRPEPRELIVDAAEFGLSLLKRPDLVAALANPVSLLAADPVTLTKAVLFPVRFLYTARTGQIGRNNEAVAHLATTEPGVIADLAVAALRWRAAPPDPNDPTAGAILRAGFRALYGHFLWDHERRMRDYGCEDLARRLGEVKEALGLEQVEGNNSPSSGKS